MVSTQPMEAPRAMFCPIDKPRSLAKVAKNATRGPRGYRCVLRYGRQPRGSVRRDQQDSLADMLATYNRFQPVDKSALHDRQHALKLLADTMQVDFVEDVNKAVAIEFSGPLLEDGTRTRATIRKLQAKLKSFWGWMVDNEFPPSDPFNKALVKSEPTIETRPQRHRTESRSRAT